MVLAFATLTCTCALGLSVILTMTPKFFVTMTWESETSIPFASGKLGDGLGPKFRNIQSLAAYFAGVLKS